MNRTLAGSVNGWDRQITVKINTIAPFSMVLIICEGADITKTAIFQQILLINRRLIYTNKLFFQSFFIEYQVDQVTTGVGNNSVFKSD
jgi:hypothetical protein